MVITRWEEHCAALYRLYNGVIKTEIRRWQIQIELTPQCLTLAPSPVWYFGPTLYPAAPRNWCTPYSHNTEVDEWRWPRQQKKKVRLNKRQNGSHFELYLWLGVLERVTGCCLEEWERVNFAVELCFTDFVLSDLNWESAKLEFIMSAFPVWALKTRNELHCPSR